MPTCIGGTLPCNISGLCLSVACPVGWTWDPTTCRCLWPVRSPCPLGAQTTDTYTCPPFTAFPPCPCPISGTNWNCPTCLRPPGWPARPFLNTDCARSINTGDCPPGWGPYVGYFAFGTYPMLTTDCGGTGGFHWCCPPTTQTCWPVDCGSCPGGTTWDAVLGYCTHPPCPPGQCWCQPSALCVSCPDPACKAERSCVWDEGTCDWSCTTPPCGPGQTYSLATCACQSGPPGIDLLEVDMGWVFRSYQDGAGNVIVQRTRDAGVAWE